MAVTAHNANNTTTAKFLDFANNDRHTHFYPSRQDCLTCHNPNANHVLGVKTPQLNGNFLYAQTGRTDNQLRTWNHLGLLNPAIDENSISNYLRLVAITNSTAPVEDRVRSYLAANCSQCHRPNGVVRANFDARYETPLSEQGIINGLVNETLNVVAAKVVSPGSLSKSGFLCRGIAYVGAAPCNCRMRPPAACTFNRAWPATLPHRHAGRYGF